VGAAASGERPAHRFGSAPVGYGLSSPNRGKEQISALFENGVMVPVRASVAAQR
jgi:hypothetical protein